MRSGLGILGGPSSTRRNRKRSMPDIIDLDVEMEEVPPARKTAKTANAEPLTKAIVKEPDVNSEKRTKTKKTPTAKKATPRTVGADNIAP